MTAPNTVAPAPTQTPVSAAAPPSLDAQSAMEETIRATLAQSGEGADDTTGARPRDPATGQFVAQDHTATAGDVPADGTVPATGPDAADEDVPTIEIPEGYVAPPALPQDRATGFTVRDADGEIVPPDLTWEITANGKPRSLSTDKLVSYAQMGVYNHEREQAYEQSQRQAGESQQRVEQLTQTVQQYEHAVERLLSDPDYLVQALQRYEQENTPEMRAQRAQQQLEAERQQLQVQQMAQQSETFVNTQLAPALEQIAGHLPTVGKEELAARLFLAADQYRVNGVLRPEGFDAIRRYVVSDLFPWAQQLHEERSAERAAPAQEAAKRTQDADAKVQAAQVRAQRAKRQAASAAKPLGRAMPESRPQQPVRTHKDAEEAVIGGTLASIRAA